MRNTAIISQQSPRYQEWLAVFGTTEIPIVNILVPNKANVLGQIRDVYMLDLRKLTEEQTERLIAHIARKFNVNIAEVRRDLHQHGVPLLAEDLIITTDQMFFL